MTWFKKKGWIYIPVHAAGWLITILHIAVVVVFFKAIDRHSHSASDTLTNFLPYFISVAVIYFFIAVNTSNQKNKNNERNNNKTNNIRNQGGIDTYGGTLFFLVGYCISSIF